MAKFVFNDGKVFSGGYDLSSHVTNVNLELTAEELDATTLQSGGFTEKLAGLKNSELTLDGFYEAGANKPDALLGTSVGNELIVTTVPDAGVGNIACTYALLCFLTLSAFFISIVIYKLLTLN